MPRHPSNRPRRTTMQDVADLAGVSLATVSFVINAKTSAKVSEATRARVWSAAQELGYRTNRAAKNLVQGASTFIGLVADAIASTPFAGQIIRGAQDAAWQNRHILLVANTEANTEAERDAITMMLEHQVTGIIYSTWYHREVTPPAALREVPCVLVNCYAADDSLPAVVPDEVQGGRTATQVLLDRGHRRIAFVNSTESAPATTGRLRGYRAALAAAGVAEDPDLVLTVRPEQEGGYEAGLLLLSLPTPPTAVFCYNDRVAMGMYDALHERGMRIPGDIAIVGFDNQEVIAGHLRPPLSTIALPHYELGARGVRMLLGGDGSAPAPGRTILDCPYIPRHSL
ncbi:LacI family DNA-binding transcriptional regulator [Acrocarpospora sp. B8E8]|uniref:LacI family DNA-binding transcriptional regulator n=1 Tax=Acrocarpospora sp. B8E8 TaxID=3153572 RepID=UPI00325C430D